MTRIVKNVHAPELEKRILPISLRHASRDHEIQLRNYFATMVDSQDHISYNVQFNQGTIAQLQKNMERENGSPLFPLTINSYILLSGRQ
jgi:hypothetical protein